MESILGVLEAALVRNAAEELMLGFALAGQGLLEADGCHRLVREAQEVRRVITRVSNVGLASDDGAQESIGGVYGA